MGKKFGDYTAETSPSADDLMIIKDTSGGDTNSVTLQVVKDFVSNEFVVGFAGANPEYECDGTSDDVQIQSAIDAADASSTNKVVRIMAGTYSLDATIVWKAGAHIIFEDGCILQPSGDFDCWKNEDQASLTSGYYAEGSLVIDGTNMTSSTNNMFELIKVTEFYLDVFFRFKNGGSRGLYIKESTFGYVSSVYADGCHDPIYIFDTCDTININSATTKNGDSDGINVRSSTNINIQNINTRLNQRNGLLVTSVTDSYFQGIAMNNNQEAVSDYHGVGVNKASGGVDSERNVFEFICGDDQGTPTQTTGITFTADTANNEFNIIGTGNIDSLVSDSGTNNIQRNKELPDASLFGGAAKLIGASYPRAFINTSSGDNTVYTVPTGKSAYVIAGRAHNTAGSSRTLYTGIEVSSTVYRMSSNISVGAGLDQDLQGGFVLNAGEKLIVNSTGTVVNISFQIIEFEKGNLKTSRVLSLSNGDNTIFTVPAGKTAMIVNPSGTHIDNGASVNVVNDSGGALNYQVYNVPNGGSSGSTNLMSQSTAVNDNTRTDFSFATSLDAGDFIVVNTSGGTTTQTAWVTYYEI